MYVDYDLFVISRNSFWQLLYLNPLYNPTSQATVWAYPIYATVL
jgi:hypothetical protein